MVTLLRCARGIVRCYPRRWRDRYEQEVIGLLDEGGVTARHVFDLFVGCGTEWGQVLLRPDPIGSHWYQASMVVLALLFGLITDVDSFSATGLWRQVVSWGPPSDVVSGVSWGLSLATLIGLLVSMMISRRAQIRVAWTLAAVVSVGGVVDRFAADPAGLGYAVRSIFWIGIVLSWRDCERHPYYLGPPIGLGPGAGSAPS